LRFDDGKIAVTAEDEDRFLLAAGQAVESCQWISKRDQLIERFKEEFLARLHAWCLEHADQISACYLVTRLDLAMTVFVIGATNRYNFALNDPISDLELEMEQKGWSCDILQLPASTAEHHRAFFREEEAILIYAQRC
jgi:hypothetical protein